MQLLQAWLKLRIKQRLTVICYNFDNHTMPNYTDAKEIKGEDKKKFSIWAYIGGKNNRSIRKLFVDFLKQCMRIYAAWYNKWELLKYKAF